MGSAKRRILYFVPELPALSSPMLHAQVFTPAGYLSKNGVDCLFVGAETSDENALSATKSISATYGIPAKVFCCHNSRIPYFSFVWTALRAAFLAKNLIRQYQPTHVYTRGYNSSLIARRIANNNGAKSVLDVRGVAAEEMAVKRGCGMTYRFILGRELNEIQKVDCLSCVSRPLREWIKRHTQRSDVAVIPSCVDTEKFAFSSKNRSRLRCSYGIGNSDTVICYSGGLGRWQRIDDIIKLCIGINRISEGFKFLFLCPQADDLKEIIRKTGLSSDRYLIIACGYNDVPSYLSVADIGIIMRYDTTINNVSSPVKIAEYLSCGLPVVLTSGIGDYSQMISEHGVGLVLDENGNVAEQVIRFTEENDLAELRRKAVSFAREELSLESHLNDFRRLFSF